MVRFIAILTPIVFITLIAGWASAADRTQTVRKLANGKTETCTYETSFGNTKDGSLVVRTAWVCVVK